jgi:NADPH-dependent 2,4-dienoyl-CoA reductase/sulfur reductase-like enzyme
VACDYFACAFGFVANVELPQLLGCAVGNGRVPVRVNLETSQPDIYCAGEPTGIGGVERALLEGQIAGTSAAGRPETAATLTRAHRHAQRFVAALDRAFALRPELQHLARPDTIVCRCEDVPRHILEPHSSWRAAKLLTRCGMGPCQGRICGEATRVLFGWEPDSVRPPLYPTRVETLGALGWDH